MERFFSAFVNDLSTAEWPTRVRNAVLPVLISKEYTSYTQIFCDLYGTFHDHFNILLYVAGGTKQKW